MTEKKKTTSSKLKTTSKKTTSVKKSTSKKGTTKKTTTTKKSTTTKKKVGVVKERKYISIATKTIKTRSCEKEGSGKIGLNIHYKYLEPEFSTPELLRWLNNRYSLGWAISASLFSEKAKHLQVIQDKMYLVNMELIEDSYLVISPDLEEDKHIHIACIPKNKFENLLID